MPGVKGAGGPPPKRSDQRRRRNSPASGDPAKAPGALVADPPRSNSKWHPIARRWFDSLASSGQSAFYEPSDWAAAEVIAESMSRELKPQPMVVGEQVRMVALPPKAASVAAWLKGFTALLVTDGDRRRAALELQHPKPVGEEAGDVAWIDDARDRLRGAG